MNRVAWRRVLPICQVALYLALLGLASLGRQIDADLRASSPPPAREELVWLGDYYGRPDPGGGYELLPVLLNFPAFLLALPVEFILDEFNHGNEVGFGIGISFFWYMVGRSLDEYYKRRFLNQPLKLMRPMWAWSGFAISALLGGFAFGIITDAPNDLEAWLIAPIWPVIGATYFGLKIHQWRHAHEPPPVSILRIS